MVLLLDTNLSKKNSCDLCRIYVEHKHKLSKSKEFTLSLSPTAFAFRFLHTSSFRLNKETRYSRRIPSEARLNISKLKRKSDNIKNMSSGNTSCPEDTMGESPIIESSEQQDENRKQKTISSSDARYTFDAAKLRELKKQSPWKNDPKYFKKVAISPSSITKMVRSHQGFMYYMILFSLLFSSLNAHT